MYSLFHPKEKEKVTSTVVDRNSKLRLSPQFRMIILIVDHNNIWNQDKPECERATIHINNLHRSMLISSSRPLQSEKNKTPISNQ
jgi:hypothetical protein